MDKVILNGNKARFYNEGNTQSGSIQYIDSKLSIKGNSSGSGVLITDGKLHLKSGDSTSSIIYDSNTQGVQFPDGLIIIGSGSTVSSIYNDNGNVHIDSGITVSNLNIEYTEGVAANIQGRVQFGSGLATGNYSHAEGYGTRASGNYSHAQGYDAITSGDYSHAQGQSTEATGYSSHAQGYGAIASGHYSHAEGYGTTTSIDNQHASGKYNAVDNNAIFIVGVGSSAARENGFWVTLTGQANAGLGFSSSGYLKVAGQSTMSNALVQNRLQVRKYYQQIGEEQTEFVIHSAPQGGNVIRIDGSGRFILIDEVNAFNVGIGMSDPQYKLDVNGAIRSSAGFTSSGYLKIGGDITSSGAKIGSGTGYVSSSAGVYSTKGGSDVMNDLGAYRTITINGTSNEVSVSTAAQNLSANRSWTIGLPDNVTITNNLTIGDNVASDVFSSGFGGSGFAISQSNNRYIAQFDDLWVRGSMNVYEMVINQIRATNGSLWVSDAGKATYATYSSTANSIGLNFQTGSLLPFVTGDILRSKRWGTSGSTTQSVWDIVTTVSTVNYGAGTLTISAPVANGTYCYTASSNGTWPIFTAKINGSGSQWVRVGNVSDIDRRGSIYLTSNDLGGPFIDVIDQISSSALALTPGDKTKVRLGKLDNLSAGGFTNMSGYGLYADNVYLRGTISATAGTFSGKVTANQGSIGGLDGWTIKTGYITSSGIQIKGGTSPAIKIGAASYGDHGIWLGKGNYYSASFWNTSLARGLKWDGQKLIVSASNFSLDANGKISANQAVISGSISSSAGQIGGWSLGSSELSSSGIVLNSSNPSIVLGGFNPLVMSDYNGVALWKNLSGQYSFFVGKRGTSPVDSDAYLQWDGSNLLISSQFFNLNSGRMTASGGQIGQWTISQNAVSANGVTLSSGTNPYIGIGTATHNGTGIFLGKSNNASMSIWSANNRGLTWNGSALIISGSNFTLSSEGSISASNAVIGGTIISANGTIGGWEITSQGITKSESDRNIKLLIQSSSNWNYINQNGYEPSNLHTDLVSVLKEFFTGSLEDTCPFCTNSSVSGFYSPSKQVYITYTNSNDVIEEGSITEYNTVSKFAFGVNSSGSLYFNVSRITPNAQFLSSTMSPSIWLQGYTDSIILYQVPLYSCGMRYPRGVNFSYLNTTSAYQTIRFRLVPKNQKFVLGETRIFSEIIGLTISNITVTKAKAYTELNPYGLLSYGGPSNYLKFSVQGDKSYGIGMVNQFHVQDLYANQLSVNDFMQATTPVSRGGTGTSSFPHRQFLWYDTASGTIQASGFSSSSGGGSGMADYSGPALTGNRVISQINITSGVMTTASRTLTAEDISAAKTTTTVTGTGLLGGGGALSANRTITHNIANGAYHLPINGSAGQLIMYSGTPGSGSWTSNIQTTGTASFASITASAGFTSSTGNIAIGGSITSSQVVKAKYFDANPNYGYHFDVIGSIRVDAAHGTALDLQDFSSLKIGDSNDYGISTNTFLQGQYNTAAGNDIHMQGDSNQASGEVIHIQGYSNQASGEVIHIQGYNNSGSGNTIHIEGFRNRAEVDYGHTQGYNAIGHIIGSKTFANGTMDGQFPYSTTQVSTIVLYALDPQYDPKGLSNQFYPSGLIDFNRNMLVIDNLHISFFLNVMITYDSSNLAYAYQQTFTYNNNGTSTEINTGEPYGDVSPTAGIFPKDLGDLELVQDQLGVIYFLYTPKGDFDISSVIVKVEMIEHIVYTS